MSDFLGAVVTVVGVVVVLGGLWIAERAMGPGSWPGFGFGVVVGLIGVGLIVWALQ